MEWNIPESAKQHRGELSWEEILLPGAVTRQHWTPAAPFIMLSGLGHNLILHPDKRLPHKKDMQHLADFWHTRHERCIMSCFCLVNPLKTAEYRRKTSPTHVRTGACFKGVTSTAAWLAMGKGSQAICPSWSLSHLGPSYSTRDQLWTLKPS